MAKTGSERHNRPGSEAPVTKLLRPIQEFIHMEVSGGLVLMAVTVLALILANSPLASLYQGIWDTRITFRIGAFEIDKAFILWINDGLMAVFFFLVGLEIKREVVEGELSTWRQAALPMAAALGGMVLPALIYVIFNPSGEALGGWAIPMATDIAFALGVMALLGKRVPLALKIFLTALAIVDDIGAVLVIAVFYTAEIFWGSLGLGLLGIALLAMLNRLGVRHTIPYLLIGLVVWAAFLKSGVHATIAGILIAMTIPLSRGMSVRSFAESSRAFLKDLDEENNKTSATKEEDQQQVISRIAGGCRLAESPLRRLEHALHPWVSFVIIPVFALANAGVSLGGGGFSLVLQPVTLGIIAGLFLGKQIGIMAFSVAAVKLGWAELPEGVRWQQIYGAAALAGIGFTMSLFIAMLGFDDAALLESAKLGILIASVLSGIAGSLLLARSR